MRQLLVLVPVQFSEVLKYRYSRTRRASSIFESLEEPVNADPLFEPIEFYRRIDFGIPVLHFVAKNKTVHFPFYCSRSYGVLVRSKFYIVNIWCGCADTQQMTHDTTEKNLQGHNTDTEPGVCMNTWYV